MRVTLDTNLVEADEIVNAGRRRGFEFAVVTVTQREVDNSPYVAYLKNLDTITETAVWGESQWGSCEWGSSESSCTLEMILRIISNGSFPAKKDRENLSAGQRHQLRDAMILEAHAHSCCDIFVTNDKRGFIRGGRRERLETQLATRIMTKSEFAEFVASNNQDSKKSG